MAAAVLVPEVVAVAAGATGLAELSCEGGAEV